MSGNALMQDLALREFAGEDGAKPKRIRYKPISRQLKYYRS
jgi:hypothetical protein